MGRAEEQEQAALAGMAHVVKSMGGAMREAMRGEGLAKNEMDVLLCLFWGHDSPSAIARAQGVSRSIVSRSVDALEKRGFIRVKRDADDRRLTRLELGRNGLDAARKAYVHWLYEGITPEEREALGGILEKMAAQVRKPYEWKGGGGL